MNCSKVLDKIYEQEKMSLFTRILIGFHLFICPTCARETERFETCKDVLRYDFLPPSPGLENSIMAAITTEEEVPEVLEAELPGGFSTRGWIIAGLVMLVSLATIFLGLDFNRVALASGMSFILPIGITVGIILTVYGLIFIGSHLKELSERFGLKV